jgi:alpha-beta hydrolase superfamily lysophospholipase
MKIKQNNINHFLKYIGLSIFFTGFCLFGLSVYIFVMKKIMPPPLNYINNTCKKCTYFTSIIRRTDRDAIWYQKQSKYLGKDIVLQPIELESQKNACNKDIKIKRKGLLMLDKNAKATILICHGFMTNKDDMGVLRYLFSGYNVMTFDFRAHGEDSSEGECTFGQEEAFDVIAAAEYIRNHPELKDKPLIVYGFSMGAVASISAQSQQSHLFDAAIWDCPFESTHDLIARGVSKMKLSLFGYEIDLPGKSFFKRYALHPWVQALFKFMMRTAARMDATQISTDIKVVSAKEAIKNITIPFLLIACHNDDKAPCEAVAEIYKNAKEAPYKRFWISAGRKHFDTFLLNTHKYAYMINKFIKEFLNKELQTKKKEKIKEDETLYEHVYVVN